MLTQVILLMMIVVISMHIFFRYMLNNPLAWTEEIARVLFIWLVFLGAALGLKDNSHPKVEYFFNKFPEKMKSLVTIFHAILIMFFSVSVVLSGVQMLSLTADEVMPGSDVSQLFYYAPVPASALLFIIIIVLALKHKISGGRKGGWRFY